MAGNKHEVIVPSGFRGLRCADGRLDQLLEPGNLQQIAQHPALLRLREVETQGALGENAAVRLPIGFGKHRDGLDTD